MLISLYKDQKFVVIIIIKKKLINKISIKTHITLKQSFNKKLFKILKKKKTLKFIQKNRSKTY